MPILRSWLAVALLFVVAGADSHSTPAVPVVSEAIPQEPSSPTPVVVVSAVRPEPGAYRYGPLVAQASRVHGVEGDLIHAVIWAESAYDPDAVSAAGASGLMQLMPDTARQYGVRDVFDPAQNIQGGARVLRDLLARFDGNVELALAGYNAGANAVERAGYRIPDHPQTAAYVPKVLGYYRQLRARKG